MGRKPQVIIGTKVKYGLAVYDDLGALLAADNAFFFRKAGSFNFGKFGGYAAYKFIIHIVLVD
jgi:hypothetical protein